MNREIQLAAGRSLAGPQIRGDQGRSEGRPEISGPALEKFWEQYRQKTGRVLEFARPSSGKRVSGGVDGTAALETVRLKAERLHYPDCGLQHPPADSDFSLLTAGRIVIGCWVVAGIALGFSIFVAMKGK